MIIGLSGFVLAKGIKRRVDVQCQVDTGIFQRVHTIIVIRTVVNGVNANGVDVEFLEPVGSRSADTPCRRPGRDSLGNVSLAGIEISNWVYQIGGAPLSIVRVSVCSPKGRGIDLPG